MPPYLILISFPSDGEVRGQVKRILDAIEYPEHQNNELKVTTSLYSDPNQCLYIP